ncbi:unnamed protein product, partial [Discosporangium mesarthrocarpum]
LGYVGFGQRSLVLDVAGPREGGRSPGVHLQFCGHALHYQCFDTFFLTMVQQMATSQNNSSIDVVRGEFHCPLCKSVSNLLVPLADPPTAEEEEDEVTTTATTRAGIWEGVVQERGK